VPCSERAEAFAKAGLTDPLITSKSLLTPPEH